MEEQEQHQVDYRNQREYEGIADKRVENLRDKTDTFKVLRGKHMS